MSEPDRDAPPPATVSEVRKRSGQPATAAFPPVSLELFRTWSLPLDLAITTRVRNGSVVVEASAEYAGRISDPPPAAAETPDPADLRTGGGGDAEARAGHRPEHLPLAYSPRMVERARTIALREGYDVPNAVFPPDSRIVFQDTTYPWSTVGRVDTESGSCTGTMVGRRLMLTGSHCIRWTTSGTGWVKFTPAYYNGSAPFGVAWAERVISWLKADGSDGLSDLETAFDYVVVVLDKNLGDVTGWTGYRTYSSSWNGETYWDQIGYPGDLTGAQRPVLFDNGAITSVGEHSTSGQQGYVLGHFIDTAGGHSGGPYWGWWDGETFPRVVGTDSTSPQTPGSGTGGDNEAGGGPGLTSLIDWARQKYP